MKLIFSMLMLPVFIAGGITGLLTLAVWFHVTEGVPDTAETLQHVYMCFIHLCMGFGLLLSILCGVYSAAMCIFGFVIKSWTRAIIAGGISAGMFWCLFYLDSVSL